MTRSLNVAISSSNVPKYLRRIAINRQNLLIVRLKIFNPFYLIHYLIFVAICISVFLKNNKE